jgi:hypothetical protein
MKYHRQHEVTLPREGKNQNGKRNPITQITRTKDRKLSKKKEKLEKLQDVPKRTPQKEGLHNWNSIGISKQRILALLQGEAI